MICISENELHSWVDSHEREAQEVTVELVSRLVCAQCPLNDKFRFPLNINQPGFDGLLVSPEKYSQFINEGPSIWEIGSGKNPEKKATDDYNKRLESFPAGDKRKKTTFTFVTPRSSWNIGKQERWIDDRQNRDGWKKIKILDATILCEWLKHFPAVAAWLFSVMNKGMQQYSIEEPLSRWKDIENIPASIGHKLTTELFLCNRESIITEVEAFLTSSNSQTLSVQTRYPDHLPYFIAAFVHSKTDAAKGEFYGNIIILKNNDALDHLVDLQYPHVFVLSDDDDKDQMIMLKSRAREKGHSFIAPRGVGGQNRDSDPMLFMPNQYDMQKSLESGGFHESKAHSLSVQSGGNIPYLLRLLSETDGITDSYWGGKCYQLVMSVASLIGAWEDRNGADIKVVEEITGKTYENWKNELALLPQRAAASLRHSNDGVYRFISRYEGWQIGGSILSQELLEKFFSVAKSILKQAANAPFDDPFQKAWATIESDTTVHSDSLVCAVAEMLAIIASNTHFWSQGSQGYLETHIDNIVSSVLDSSDINVWKHLREVLPLLAEASPQYFLKRLREQIATPAFINGDWGSSDWMFNRSPMAPILWGLEGLAWDSKWFPEVVAILGDLSQIDLPRNSCNRPIESLSEIFIVWKHHTLATQDQKSKHLAVLARKHPQLAWEVILKVSPYSQVTSFGTYMPRWREFSQSVPAKEKEITLAEFLERFESVTDSALEILLQPNKLTLKELSRGLMDIPHKFDQILLLFTRCGGTPEQKEAWEQLLDTSKWIKKRKGMADCHVKLSDAIKDIEPSDKYEQYKRFFDNTIPDYFINAPHKTQIEDWRQEQVKIVTAVFQKDGIDGILRLASLAKMPGIIGLEVAKIADDTTDSFLLVNKAPLPYITESTAKIFLAPYISIRNDQGGDHWISSLWNRVDVDVQLNLLLYLPFEKKIWNRVETLPKDMQRKYWESVRCGMESKENDPEYPLRKLMEVERNGDALQWLYLIRIGNCVFPKFTTLKDLLLNPDATMTHNHHDVLEVIKYMRELPDSCCDDLANIELFWIMLFRPPFGEQNHPPECLNRKMLTDSKYFVDAITILYKPQHEESKSEPAYPNQQNLAILFYNAFKALRPPKDFSFAGPEFAKWVDEVKEMSKKYDRYESACRQLGKVLFHASPDPDGFWIDRKVASILDVDAHVDMRSGFSTESINSRGIFMCTQGRGEQDIARSYEKKAEELRDEGYFNFAGCVEKIAKDYDCQARMAQERSLGDF